MKIIKWAIKLMGSLLLPFFILNACRPIKNFTGTPAPWSTDVSVQKERVHFDQSKKTVFIIGDYRLTELFDMLAPYYLFNATGKANVYIVAKEQTPILIKKDLFVQPQLTFEQADLMGINPDVIVIPALSVRKNNQDSVVISWIKKHYHSDTRILSICDGASTAAATGLYDGKSITCHASDIAGIKPHFRGPVWVQNVSVAKSGNLFSTAGVSNAVEGSLTVIRELFGNETMQSVIADIHYPHKDVRLDHKSVAVSGSNKMTALKKIFFRKNKEMGLLLGNGLNEFQFASVLDTYARTFPASITTYIMNDSTVRTRYGLSLIYTGGKKTEKVDELHILTPQSFLGEEELLSRSEKLVRYGNDGYVFDVCLKRISEQYGSAFANLVKISLDYN